MTDDTTRMTGTDHYREAEHLLAAARIDDGEGSPYYSRLRPEDLAAAQAHATLALAAATAQPAVSLAKFAADLQRLIKEYSDPERGVIALLPFAATVDQVLFEKYGVMLDEQAGGESP